PLHFESTDAPSIFAMRLTLVANATLFSSLLFGGLFLWLTGGSVPTAISASNSSLAIFISGILASIAGLVASAQTRWRSVFCLISLAFYLAASGMQMNELWSETTATSHALLAVKFA